MASQVLTPQAVGSISDLSSRFDDLARRIRQVAFVRGLGRLAIVATLLCGLGLLADWLWPMSAGVRMAWLGIVVVAVGYTLWSAVLRPVFCTFTVAELAAIVESHYPHLGERLTSAVELTDPGIPEDHKGSALMREWLEADTLTSTEDLDFRQAVSSDRAKKTVGIGIFAAAVLAAPFLWASSSYGQLWSRFLTPWVAHELPAELYFQIPNGDRLAARGEDLTILAFPPKDVAPENLPQDVTLEWTTSGGETQYRPMTYSAEENAFTVTLPHVFEGFDYLVTAPRKRSERHTITVADRPEIQVVLLTITPPGYTGLPERRVDGSVKNVVAFERSRIQATVGFSHPVTKAEWVWEEFSNPESDAKDQTKADTESKNLRPTALPFLLSADRKTATVELLASSGWFSVKAQDDRGLTTAKQPARNLMILTDQAPKLVLTGQIGTTRARRNDKIQFEAKVVDDLRVAELELHLETAQGKTDVQSVPAAELGKPEVQHGFTLDLAKLELADGEWVKYRVRAADNRPLPRPNEVWSEERRIVIDPNAAPPGSEEVAQQQNDLRTVLEAIRQDVEKNREAMETLRKEATARKANNEPFTKQPELANLEQQQRDLAARLESLALKFGEHRLFANLTPETQRIARESVNEVAEQLNKAQAQPDLENQIERLEISQEELAAASQDLDKLAKRFDELADLERDLLVLPRLANQAERVAEQALDLSKRRDNPPAEETPDQQAAREQEQNGEQAALDQERQELTEELDKLFEHRPEILEAARKALLDQIGDLSKQAGDLANRQEGLTEALKNEAQEAAKEAAPIAEKQEELIKKAENLEPKKPEPKAEPKPDPKVENPSQQVTPIDPEELRKVLEQLKAGNLEAAKNQQQAIADRLEKLAEELQKQEELAKAKELADRQQQAANTTETDSQTAKDKQTLPSPEVRKTQQDELAELAKDTQDLQVDQKAEEEKQEALESLKKAAEKQEELEELIKKKTEKPAANPQKPNDPKAPQEPEPKADEELQRLIQENAKAQKDAADALKRLEQEMAKQEKEEELHNELNDLKQLAKKLVKAQAEKKDQETLDSEDVEQLADDARKVEKDIEQLKKDRETLENEQVAQAEPKSDPNDPRAENQEPNQEQPKPSDPNNSEPNQEPRKGSEPNASDPNNSEPNASDPNNSEPNASDPNRSDPKQSPAPDAKNADTKPNNENAKDPNPQRAEQSSQPADAAVKDLKARQAALAQQAENLANKIEADQGEESQANQNAKAAAENAEAARQQSSDGILKEAAKSAQKAADAAQAAAEELKDAPAPLAQEAKDQAQAQSDLAKELKNAAENPALRQAAQKAGQQALADSSKKLAQDLKQAAKQLTSQPLDLEKPGEKTDAAGEAATQASKEMQKAQADANQGDSANAATAGEKASESLRQAAGQSPAPMKATPENTLVPKDLAQQVAEARRQLEEAREQLKNAQAQAQSPPQQPMSDTNPSKSSDNKPGDNANPMSDQKPSGDPSGEPSDQKGQPGQGDPAGQPGEGQPGEGQPSGQAGQGQPSALAQSAKSLGQAAQSLSEAAQQMQGGVPGQNSNSAQASNSANSQGGPSSSASEGTGSQAPISLDALEAELHRQNRQEWGLLHGQLKTEILQGGGKKAGGDYAKLIELYSEEVNK